MTCQLSLAVARCCLTLRVRECVVECSRDLSVVTGSSPLLPHAPCPRMCCDQFMSANFLALYTISDIDRSSSVFINETGLKSEGLIIRISLIQQMTESYLCTLISKLREFTVGLHPWLSTDQLPTQFIQLSQVAELLCNNLK